MLGLIPDLLHPFLLGPQNCFKPCCSPWKLTSIYFLHTLTCREFYVEYNYQQVRWLVLQQCAFPFCSAICQKSRKSKRNLTGHWWKSLKARVASELWFSSASLLTAKLSAFSSRLSFVQTAWAVALAPGLWRGAQCCQEDGPWLRSGDPPTFCAGEFANFYNASVFFQIMDCTE